MLIEFDNDALYPKPEGVVYRSLWKTGSHRYRSQTISETDDRIRIEIELPGVNPEQVHIDVLEHAIRVHVERSGVYEGDHEDRVRYIDDRYSGFERVYRLPPDIDPDRASATFVRNTLRIDIPKIGHTRNTIPIA